VNVPQSAVIGALRAAIALADRHAREVGATPGSLTLGLTNGRQLYMLRRGSPLCVVRRDRLSRGSEEQLGEKQAQQAVRYVVVASHRGPNAPTGYRDVPEGQVVYIDRDLRVTE